MSYIIHLNEKKINQISIVEKNQNFSMQLILDRWNWILHQSFIKTIAYNGKILNKNLSLKPIIAAKLVLEIE